MEQPNALLLALLLGLTACGESEPPPIAARPDHPLNEVESYAALETALEAGYPVVERHVTGNGGTLWVAGPEGTEVTWTHGEAGWPIEVPFVRFLVEFPDRHHVVSDQWVGNGELTVDDELHAGWGFALTADHGLATFPFGNDWVRMGLEEGLEEESTPEPPPRRWAEALAGGTPAAEH